MLIGVRVGYVGSDDGYIRVFLKMCFYHVVNLSSQEEKAELAIHMGLSLRC